MSNRVEPVRALIFDVDGVLVDSPHGLAWGEAMRELMTGPWRDLPSEYVPERYTAEVYQRHVAGMPRVPGAAAMLRYFGVPDPTGKRARELAATKQDRLVALIEAGRFSAFDDGLRLLRRAREAGVRLAAASSSRNANTMLARLRMGGVPLSDMFEANVCGRDFPRGKPDPAIFLSAAAELGVRPAGCVVVEDARSGVEAAKAAGMRCIGVARLGDEQLLTDAEWVVDSLDRVNVLTGGTIEVV